MSFVIKDNFDNHGYITEDYLFDLEGYDFILNNETILTEESLVQENYEKLNFILKNFQQIDLKLMGLLYYQNSQKQLPLHISIQGNNNRIINLILKYMSYVPISQTSNLKDIFCQLLNYQNFTKYIAEAPF
jgi:hypothetical protein